MFSINKVDYALNWFGNGGNSSIRGEAQVEGEEGIRALALALQKIANEVTATDRLEWGGFVPDGSAEIYSSPAVSESPTKSLHNTDINGAHKSVPDIQTFGNGDMWQLLCKASSESEGWMKSTKAMEIPGIGCLVQVTTQQRNPDGSYAVAEAIELVRDAVIKEDLNVLDGSSLFGRHLELANFS